VGSSPIASTNWTMWNPRVRIPPTYPLSRGSRRGTSHNSAARASTEEACGPVTFSSMPAWRLRDGSLLMERHGIRAVVTVAHPCRRLSQFARVAVFDVSVGQTMWDIVRGSSDRAR